MQTEHSPFPSDETLAAYIDGRVDQETRKRVVEHMAECPECFDVVMVGRAITRFPQQKAVAHVMAVAHVITWPRNLVIAIPAAAAVAMAVFLTPIRDRIWPHDDIRALVAVAPPQRFTDGRISGFPYQRRAATLRGGETESSSDLDWRLSEVAARIAKAAQEKPSPNTLHAEGVSNLVVGHNADAVKELEAAVEAQTGESDVAKALQKSTNAALLNDVSAAYVAVGDYTSARKTAERAWFLSRAPESAWNRAVAAERLKDREAAISAWEEYLRLDSKSSWSNEARQHLRRVRDPNDGFASSLP